MRANATESRKGQPATLAHTHSFGTVRVTDEPPLNPNREPCRIRLFGLSVAAASLAAMGMGSVANADPTSSHSGGAKANQTGVVRIDPNDPQVAYLTGNYTCPPGFAHLFVSVKQVPSGRPDSALKLEGSSSISSGWLERHPGPDEFTCDGTQHTGTWRITSDPSDPDYVDGDGAPAYGFGALVPGQVYVQFCWDGPDWHAYSEQLRTRARARPNFR